MSRYMFRKIYFLILTLTLLFPLSKQAQQLIDSTFTFNPKEPVYAYDQGPIIHIDEYHHNDMSMNNRMFPLIPILRNDGYRVASLNQALDEQLLSEIKILVIIGALHESNVDNWKLPTPSSLTRNEEDALISWVEKGGSLLLVADHMPFPGAISNLSGRLGVEWHNGFVIDSVNWGMSIFTRRENTLMEHPLLNGRSSEERINWVATYYGSGFKIKDPSIIGLFSFDNPNIVSYQTEEAWRMNKNTPVIDSKDLYQAAIQERGKGKIAFIGEASLFSAQLVGKNKNPVGINLPNEGQNLQFVLNLFHWLSGALD